MCDSEELQREQSDNRDVFALDRLMFIRKRVTGLTKRHDMSRSVLKPAYNNNATNIKNNVDSAVCTSS